MAVIDQKDNLRLKLEFDGGIENNRQVVKSKIYTKIKPNATSEDLYQVAITLAGLQTMPLLKVKKLEEVELVEEI